MAAVQCIICDFRCNISKKYIRQRKTLIDTEKNMNYTETVVI